VTLTMISNKSMNDLRSSHNEMERELNEERVENIEVNDGKQPWGPLQNTRDVLHRPPKLYTQPE
jgi:hypothetical protein